MRGAWVAAVVVVVVRVCEWDGGGSCGVVGLYT